MDYTRFDITVEHARRMDYTRFDITVEHARRHIPVAILRPEGILDASTYQAVIAKAVDVCNAGASNIIVDLSRVWRISACGLVALHSIAQLVRGEAPLDPEPGWDVLHTIARDLDSGVQQHIVLLNPQADVEQVLERAGFNRFLAVYTDLEEAIGALTPNVRLHATVAAMGAVVGVAETTLCQPSLFHRAVTGLWRRTARMTAVR